MNVSLTPELEALVQEKVRSGRYRSASEVVRAALQLLRDRDRQLPELLQEIEIGEAALERGELTELDVERIKAEGRARLARRKESP